jgi:hypothetical protein
VSFELEFLTMMPDTLYIEQVLTRDLQGQPATYTDPAPYRCRVSGKGLALRRGQGEEATVIFDAWVHAGAAVFSTEDRITLPPAPQFAEFTDRPPVIFAIARYTDENSHHSVKIQFGWMYHRQGQ